MFRPFRQNTTFGVVLGEVQVYRDHAVELVNILLAEVVLGDADVDLARLGLFSTGQAYVPQSW